MASYFFDSSALAKRYVAETGTAWVQSLADPATGNSLYVARITLVELVSAITRRQRNGDLTPAAATAALTDVKADFVSDYQVIEVTASLVTAASAFGKVWLAGIRCRSARRRAGSKLSLRVGRTALHHPHLVRS
ncbi:MAG TPA: type II toxin-antitoxin system VapC family toxin [Pyrinomonadaceae bacterium]|jgi:hypothetical protein